MYVLLSRNGVLANIYIYIYIWTYIIYVAILRGNCVVFGGIGALQESLLAKWAVLQVKPFVPKVVGVFEHMSSEKDPGCSGF